MCSDGARSRAAILDAAGVEAESDLAFAALHQLLWPVTGSLDALPGPQGDAVRAALGLAPGAAGDARRRPPEVHEELAAAVLAVSRW